MKTRVVVLDGAMGTQLQQRGLPAGACPEAWCAAHPEVLRAIHADYISGGADIIYTCTFGANREKLSQYNLTDVFSLNKDLAKLARAACGKTSLVAGDIGPTGKFVKPFGELEFEDAVDVFKAQVRGLLAGGVHLFVIETMMDIQEARAALLAVKELSDAFTIVTLTFEKSGRTLNGNDPVSALITLQSLGADAVGCNCSTGPKDMARIIARMAPYAAVPLVAKPNAGVPKLVDNRTVFNMDAATFGAHCRSLASAGAGVMGGCCGTTPEHIRALKKAVRNIKPRRQLKQIPAALSSARSFVALDRKKFCMVGEKINPTGKKKLQAELMSGNFSLVRQFAKEQEAQGAGLLDVNMGVPGADEKKLLTQAISILSIATDLPLVIDSSNADAVESALRLYPGRALVNSLSGEKERIRVLVPLLKKYGAMCVLLPLQSKKLPRSCAERKKIVLETVRAIQKGGLMLSDLVVDGLVLTVSTQPDSGVETLKTIAWCSKSLKVNTVVGLSNISFGLPQRHLLNRTFLTLAKAQGLSLAIADPQDALPSKNKFAQALLRNKDAQGRNYIARFSGIPAQKPSEAVTLSAQALVSRAIIEGDKDTISGLVRQALQNGIDAYTLMQSHMIPAIITVGEYFEQKRYFLPQLIASAEAMKQGIDIVEPLLAGAGAQRSKTALVLMATVEGDVHDIGKNIVTLMLKNHGFTIVDLGKDVSTRKIIECIKTHKPDIVGLSALMTTTMVNIAKVVEAARQEKLQCKFMIGGAVVSRHYAQSLGVAYAKDGVEAVRIARDLSGSGPTAL